MCTLIDGDTGEIISWDDFYISIDEINEFNEVVKEYSETTKIVPNTWELVHICFKDEHLKVPTLEEFKSVSRVEEEIFDEENDYIIWKSNNAPKKEKSHITKICNEIGDLLTLMICIIIPPIILIMFFIY